MNYNEIRDILRVRLMSIKGNEQILDSVTHRIYEDMAMVYVLDYYPQPKYITNELLDIWGVDEEKLHEDALEAAHDSCGMKFRSIGQVFESNGDITEDPSAFYIVTTDAPYGAWALFYKNFMADFYNAKDCDGYYILPSSIHEMLLLPDNDFKPEELEKIVAEINATAVEPEDRLTDSVYYYDKDGFRRVA